MIKVHLNYLVDNEASCDAGILAIEPEILVLDEPTAGLDPAGRKELMALFETLHKMG